ncbi:MAG: hypothetical protein POH28_01345 [Acidocella sp.]|nr:hypothetical protein [Acidocella sp.]
MPYERPQLRISVPGMVIPGPVSMEINANGFFEADRFCVSFALDAAANTGIDDFAGFGLQVITIEAAIGGFGFGTLLVGQVDNVQIKVAERIAVLSGRDLSCLLVDTQVSESFVNQTASQIATLIAQRHNLVANVTSTSAVVGQYYELAHARVAMGQHARATTEWGLLVELAWAEGFDVSVTGRVLNFGPPVSGGPVFLSAADFTDLSFDVAASLPTGLTVRSWSTRNKAVCSAHAGDGGATRVMVRPNLTQDRAERVAMAELATLARHGMVLEGRMPAEMVLSPGMEMVLSGTNSKFDQSYDIAMVTRRLNVRSGFVQMIRAYAIG